MNKNILLVLTLITGILVVGAITNSVVAQTNNQTASEISYPLAELGNCTDKANCKVYCDKQENMDNCLIFAEKNNLMSKEEIKVAKNFKSTGMVGPGGCKGKDECSSYCNGPEHMDACISFAEKNGMMSSGQLEEAKKVQGAIAKGIKPPACGGKDACDAYCSSKEHMAECVGFAEAAGIISKEEADKIKSGGPERQGGQDQGQNGPDGQQGPGGQQGEPGGGNGNGGRQGQEPGSQQGQQGPGDNGPGGQNQQGQQGPGGPGDQNQDQGTQ